jgi:nucleotide-binding universal stress UspA family protein
MAREQVYDAPMIESILHPSDFSQASDLAFAHAMKIALVARARLTMFHVSPGIVTEWTDFPRVRQTLERWGLLPPGSPRSAVPDLGIAVEKIIARDRDAVSAVLRFLELHPADLLVLAPHRHHEGLHWFRRSVSEPIVRRAGQAALFVPDGVRGFVSNDDGAVSLASILIPVTATPPPSAAVAGAARLVSRLSRPAGMFTLLHVGAAGEAPPVDPPPVAGWRWDKVIRAGDVVETILDTAHRTRADLIVMTTDGREGFLDTLRGSHSERVLRGAPCPLLVLPKNSLVTEGLRES